MTQTADPIQGSKRRLVFPAFFLLFLVESFIALFRLVLIPADPKNSVLFGFSLSRLAMIAFVLAAAGVAALAAFRSWHSTSWREKWLEWPVRSRLGFLLSMVGVGLLALGSWLVLVFLRFDETSSLFSYYQRMHPLLTLSFLFGVQGLIILPFARFGSHWDWLNEQKSLLRASLLVFAGFAVLVLLIALTGFGITPDLYAWWSPGVPLLAWQVLFICLLGCGLFLVFSQLRLEASHRKNLWLDLGIALVIWAVAAGLWLSQPVQTSFFNPQKRAPNFEYYAYSDAGYYDFNAESLISGSGYGGHKVVTRAVYILFLALLRTMVGHGYEQVIFWQTLVLALFPVTLYFLGRGFHSRAAGVTIALLAIVRELNAFASTPLTEVSHSKMLLSDMPAALGTSTLVLLLFLWLRKPERRWMPLAVGGLFGVLILVRSQSMIHLPFILLAALIVYRRRLLRWIEASALLGLGVFLIIFPWMVRNYSVGGAFILDQPGNQMTMLAERYSTTVQEKPPRLPGETDGAYSDRMVGMVKQFVLEYPVYTVGFVTAHFLNNEIGSLAVLPLSVKFDDYRDMWSVNSLFWAEIIPNLTGLQFILLMANLFFISVGIGFSWQKWNMIGLLPIILGIGYSLSNSIARNSGWRYILPVDWIPYFYFVIGVIQVFTWLLALWGQYSFVREGSQDPGETVHSALWNQGQLRKAFGFGLLFLGFGLAVPLAEYAYPVRYPVETKEQILSMLIDSPAFAKGKISSTELQSFAAQENAVVLRGKAIFPRFYYSEQGESGNAWAAYRVREGSRLGFMVVTSDNVPQVILRLNKEPAYFPHASEVIMAGCRTNEGYLDAAIVVVSGNRQALYVRPLTGGLTCPLK